jgi:hypothetical protein
MSAIASLEDLKVAQKGLLEAKNLKIETAFKKWRRSAGKTSVSCGSGKTPNS